MRFTCTSNIESGSTATPVRPCAIPARSSLLERLIARQSLWNAASSANFSRSLRRARSLIHPSPMASQMSSHRRGVVRGQPAAWRDAVGLVAELLGPQLVEILEYVLLQQLGMQVGDTVDRVAAN